MNTTTRINTAQRLGRSLGRGCRAYLRGERRLSAWLVLQGMSGRMAQVLLWTVKLGVLGVLLYFAVWLAALLALVVAAAQGDWGAEQDPPEPEWREGPVGFGLYTYDGYRIDPHDFEDEA